jgi:hypothetical protein
MSELATDNPHEMEVLQDAAIDAPKGPDQVWIEVGTRAGGSARVLIDQMRVGQVLVSVDPYGGLPYYAFGTEEGGMLVAGASDGPIVWDWVTGEGLGYTDKMRTETTAELLRYSHARGVYFIPLLLADTDFMRAFPEGVPTYRHGHRRVLGSYGLVFLDGPHDSPALAHELGFFVPRLAEGGIIVVDDALVHHRKDFWDQICRRFGLVVSGGNTKLRLERGEFRQDPLTDLWGCFRR